MKVTFFTCMALVYFIHTERHLINEMAVLESPTCTDLLERIKLHVLTVKS